MGPRAAENWEMQILEPYASTVNSEGGVQAIGDLSIQVILMCSEILKTTAFEETWLLRIALGQRLL